MSIWENMALAIRDEIFSAERGSSQPPKFDRYPTCLVLVWGPLRGKHSPVHSWGIISYQQSANFRLHVSPSPSMSNLVCSEQTDIRVHGMLYWGCSEQSNIKVLGRQWHIHSPTSWLKYHLPGSYNAWLFYLCKVCLAEKRNVWGEGKSSMRRLGLQSGKPKKKKKKRTLL